MISRHHVTELNFACALPVEVTVSLTNQIVRKEFFRDSLVFEVFRDHELRTKIGADPINETSMIFGQIQIIEPKTGENVGIKKCWATKGYF